MEEIKQKQIKNKKDRLRRKKYKEQTARSKYGQPIMKFRMENLLNKLKNQS